MAGWIFRPLTPSQLPRTMLRRRKLPYCNFSSTLTHVLVFAQVMFITDLSAPFGGDAPRPEFRFHTSERDDDVDEVGVEREPHVSV